MLATERICAYYLRDGYAGKGHGLTGWYRDLTIGEAKKRNHGALHAIDKHGRVRECRTNGAPKTWKTRPGCELPLKYGLKECFRVGRDDATDGEPLSGSSQVRIVVAVKREFMPDAPPEIVADYCMEYEVK